MKQQNTFEKNLPQQRKEKLQNNALEIIGIKHEIKKRLLNEIEECFLKWWKWFLFLIIVYSIFVYIQGTNSASRYEHLRSLVIALSSAVIGSVVDRQIFKSKK